MHCRGGAALRSLAPPPRFGRIAVSARRACGAKPRRRGTGRSPSRRAHRSERAGPAMRRNASRRARRGSCSAVVTTERVARCPGGTGSPPGSDPAGGHRAVHRYAAFQGGASPRWCCTAISRVRSSRSGRIAHRRDVGAVRRSDPGGPQGPPVGDPTGGTRLVRRSGGAAGARHAAGKFGHSPARASCDPSGGTAMRAERLLLGASPVFKPRRSWRVGSYHTWEKW